MQKEFKAEEHVRVWAVSLVLQVVSSREMVEDHKNRVSV